MVHSSNVEKKEGPSDETMIKRENTETAATIQTERESSVNDEPSSPLPDPMDIVRITVGAVLPVSLKDFQTIDEQDPRIDCNPVGNRKEMTNNSLCRFKNRRMISFDNTTSEMVHHNTCRTPKKSGREVFKCRYCLKVFRFTTGLHRHVNKYHNPAKPYVCNICHMHFHSNFKVWTHCQTQHGVVQTPAFSSPSGLDKTFEKKMDFAQNREMKKALLWEQKRNKQNFKAPRYVHPSGKAFVFQSQHTWKYPAENADQDTTNEGNLHYEQGGIIQPHTGEHSCGLCSMKLSSVFEQGCCHTTADPRGSLRLSSPSVNPSLETQSNKLSCPECNRIFKSSFSIWRHRVEVHNHNMLTVGNQVHLNQQEKVSEMKEEVDSDEHQATGSSREISNSDSSTPHTYDSEDSWSCVPEDLSLYGKLVVKEEPLEEPVSNS